MRGLLRKAYWYVAEMLGENAYRHYVEHLRAHHPEASVPSEREFWKETWAERGANPGARCC
ncbi:MULTISPECIES: YbdD/YjiX family protein [unclassified Corynebacterium]|uniref:YbdD/YjiX family protein n=1 Tax=unclassified Corynebacterium TaxID=2624378 RepID=UPI0029C9F485|nr:MULTISPECIES: YbdD/YjiX family protein [unclassified Corynebacterium]WPF66584.1 YbdD/YjiX family protein [Corynebacterium sp. 22KM0430]WPF69072.1 YbdD/YjiX family protein [Corynebacterium sp. 21KM1197]